MNGREEDLLERLLGTFKIEAQEHLETVSAALLELERAADPVCHDAALEVVYRAAHSLKGGARIVNLTLIELLCQSLEDCLAGIRKGAQQITPEFMDLLHKAISIIEKILSSPQPEAPATALKSVALKLRQQLDESMKPAPAKCRENSHKETSPAAISGISLPVEIAGGSKESFAPEPPASGSEPTIDRPRSVESDSVRIPAARLDELMMQAEEMISLKLAMRQQLSKVKEVLEDLSLTRRLIAGAEALDRERIHELDRSLAALSSDLVHLRRSGEDEWRLASGQVEKLISDTKNLLMFPFSSLTEGFPRMVRELSREQGKEIDFRLSGESIELDRRILQELKDPIMHMVRNCVDHGIEEISERLVHGKPARSLIEVKVASIDNGKVEITISDDGKGIDSAQVLAAAVRLGVISEETAGILTPEDVMKLVFNSGLSSRRSVTHISGRGLGLAIVSDRVEKLGGTVTVESTPGRGTCFILHIPLTLATFRGIRIRVGERYFAVPTLNVKNVCRAAMAELKTVGNRETLNQGESTIPVVPLGGILGVHHDSASTDLFRTMMLLGSGAEQVAFVIDEVMGEDDLLVKGLGPQLVRVRNISGATVLGDGTVVPILNTFDLLKSALGGHAVTLPPISDSSAVKSKQTAHRILVVDDSITSRTLLKNVLESYGYDVTTAVEGFDALSALQGGDFDLVSSDVQMPRMDGFELTARIRADERFSRLPVVLVTSMDSAEDRTKGINAGADAYIVKSSFDQSNLLDIIRKLI